MVVRGLVRLFGDGITSVALKRLQPAKSEHLRGLILVSSGVQLH
jgi:hypothetical protein